MKFNRNTTRILHFILDECIPPLLRDNKWFMWLPFKLLFKDKSDVFFDFKCKALNISEEQFSDIYQETSSVHIQRETDLNEGCVKEIEKNALGNKILEVGCGRGYLSGLLSRKYKVTACDMKISQQLIKKYPPG